MNKRLVILVVVLAAMLLSAVGPWPATLTVWNFTGDNVYIKLSKYGVMKYFLTATVEGNTDSRYLSRFDITRRTYSAQVTACGVTTTWGNVNMNSQLRLTFTVCESMKQWDTPKYWGEPGMEKPNFYSDGDWEFTPPDWGWYGSLYEKDLNPLTNKDAFHFLYDVVP